jgi:hypothetical protein
MSTGEGGDQTGDLSRVLSLATCLGTRVSLVSIGCMFVFAAESFRLYRTECDRVSSLCNDNSILFR